MAPPAPTVVPSIACVPAIEYSSNLHPDYHTVRDGPENINYAKLTKMTQWMYLTGWFVANADKRLLRRPEVLEAVVLLVDGLAQMGVEAHALLASQLGRFAHQLRGHRERRARRQRDLQPGLRRGVVPAVDGVGAGLQDRVVVLRDRVRREAALGDAEVHRTPSGMEAQPDPAGRLDFGCEQVTAVAGEYVVMVHCRRAARQRQGAEAGAGGRVLQRRIEPGPHRVEAGEPFEQRPVRRIAPRDPLVEVVVSVHQAGCREAAPPVDYPGALDVRCGSGADRRDAVT